MAEFLRNIRNKDLANLAKPFGNTGQIGTRKLSVTSGWVPQIIFLKRTEGDAVDSTTFIVKDKEFDESYKARQWMSERLAGIFEPVEAV